MPIVSRFQSPHIEEIREMYRQAIDRLLNEVAETEQFFRAGIIAIAITEADPFTGDRTGHEDKIIGTKEQTDEYAYQWATVQLVGNAVPIVLDARPVRKGETRKEIVEDLLDSAEEMIHVEKQLTDETLPPERTVRYALSTLEDADIVESQISFRDARQRCYSLMEGIGSMTR